MWLLTTMTGTGTVEAGAGAGEGGKRKRGDEMAALEADLAPEPQAGESCWAIIHSLATSL